VGAFFIRRTEEPLMAARNGSPISAILAIVVVLTGSVLYFQSSFKSKHDSASRLLTRTALAGNAAAGQHYSPFENLEQIDRERLDSAQHTVDIAMYAFTDRYVAEELVKLSRRGVQIRLYRDRQQYEEEQRNRGTTTEMLRGERGIQIRVKGSRELMHLKAYVIDGSLLRDGSANWSPSGLKRQDNNAHFTSDPAQVGAFRQIFEQMWNRTDNERVQ
jgi:phosphatidylserine/phosphatidylglycerophosphate/cardiolipin synthase-like enzyme